MPECQRGKAAAMDFYADGCGLIIVPIDADEVIWA